MTGFTAAFLCSILAFTSLIQLCPAPPIVAGIVGGVALGAGAAIGGAAAAGHRGRKRDVSSGANNNNTTATTLLRGSKMSACMAENLGADPPRIDKISDTSFVIGGIVPACMTAIRAYNDDPNIINLNAAHGTTTVINGTACFVHGVPKHIMSTMNHFLENFPDAPTHTRRAIDGSVSI